MYSYRAIDGTVVAVRAGIVCEATIVVFDVLSLVRRSISPKVAADAIYF